MVASEILTSSNIITAIIRGPSSTELFKIIHNNIKEAIDNFSGPGKPLIQMTLGVDDYVRVKVRMSERVCEVLPFVMKHGEEYMVKQLDIENTLTDKMTALPAKQFEGLLHPVFQEDEWKLVLMGGALGVVIGAFQILLGV